MERKLIVSIFFLFACGTFSLSVYANSQISCNNQDRVMALDDGTILYWRNVYKKDFSQITGFGLKNEPLSFWRIVNGANDTLYVNTQFKDIVQSEGIWSDEDYYQLKVIDYSSSIGDEYDRYKYYTNDKQKWCICISATDGPFIFGHKYCIDKHHFDDATNGDDDSDFVAVIFFLMIYFAFATILPYWDHEKFGGAWWISGFLLSLCGAIIIESYTQRQLFLPLLTIAFTAILFKIPQYIGKVRYISQFIIGCIISAFFGYAQYFNTNETITLADGKNIDVNWEKGTCLIKRNYIKHMFSNMIPVLVESKGKEYILYISKYEFSEDDFNIVVDEPMNWLNVLFKFNRPLDNLSFRESQIMLELLQKITGVKFDFLSYDEWKAAALYKSHVPNNMDYSDVNEGDVNDNGLVNILGNMPEYTSNYYSGNYRIGLAADTIIKSYNNVAIAGSAYKCADSINLSFVNKNTRMGRVGFRLVYRPNDIGVRKFCIKGYLRSDKKHTQLPQYIELVSMDGHSVEEFSCYESFEEFQIECRFKNKIIHAIDLSNNKEFSFQHPKGFEYYDFEPHFSFVRLD